MGPQDFQAAIELRQKGRVRLSPFLHREVALTRAGRLMPPHCSKLRHNLLARRDTIEQALKGYERSVMVRHLGCAAAVLDQYAVKTSVGGISRRGIDAHIRRDPGKYEAVSPESAQRHFYSRGAEGGDGRLPQDSLIVARTSRRICRGMSRSSGCSEPITR